MRKCYSCDSFPETYKWLKQQWDKDKKSYFYGGLMIGIVLGAIMGIILTW